jgi:hypothetical protein
MQLFKLLHDGNDSVNTYISDAFLHRYVYHNSLVADATTGPKIVSALLVHILQFCCCTTLYHYGPVYIIDIYNWQLSNSDAVLLLAVTVVRWLR